MTAKEHLQAIVYFGVHYFKHRSLEIRTKLLKLINTLQLPSIITQPRLHPAEYCCVHYTSDISVSIFMLAKGQIMPCHDHPEMTVFCKILSGTVLIHTYKFSSSNFSRPCGLDDNGLLADLALLVEKTSFIANDSTLAMVMSPEGYTLHSFTALTDVWIFDVLSPPYQHNSGASSTTTSHPYYHDVSLQGMYFPKEADFSKNKPISLLDAEDPASLSTATHYSTDWGNVPLNTPLYTWIIPDDTIRFDCKPARLQF